MRDDFGIGLAFEAIALRLQLGAQLVVVLDDAVVDEADPPGGGQAGRFPGVGIDRGRRAGCSTRAGGEVRMRVVNERRAMGGPARVRDAGERLEAFGGDVGRQLGDARGAARAAQAAALMDGDAARVLAPVFEAAQTLDEDRDDVAGTDGRDDSAHGSSLKARSTVRPHALK